MIYIDEAGFDNRLFRERARAPRGIKIHANRPGKKRERVSMIAGLLGKQMIAPFTFQGGCTADVFNLWLEDILLPVIPKKSVLILDNAAFHKTPQTAKLIEKAGCFLKFLPTYSPDLNPIEHCWHQVKSRVKHLMLKQTQMEDALQIILAELSCF